MAWVIQEIKHNYIGSFECFCLKVSVESFTRGNALTDENEEFPCQGNILEDDKKATFFSSLASGRQVLGSMNFKLHSNILVNIKTL